MIFTGDAADEVRTVDTARGRAAFDDAGGQICARDAADKVVFMENGLVVDAGTPEYLFGPDSNERVQAFLSKIL